MQGAEAAGQGDAGDGGWMSHSFEPPEPPMIATLHNNTFMAIHWKWDVDRDFPAFDR